MQSTKLTIPIVVVLKVAGDAELGRTTAFKNEKLIERICMKPYTRTFTSTTPYPVAAQLGKGAWPVASDR